MRSLAGVLVWGVLAGCSLTGAVGDTPAQRLHAHDGAYRALLSLAVAYKEACDARPPALRSTCAAAVMRLRDLDARYAVAREAAASGEAARLAALEAALGAFNAYLATRLASGGARMGGGDE